MNKTVAFIAVLAALAVGIFYFLNYVQPAQANFSDLSGVNPEDYVAYRHEEGFEFAYPHYFAVDSQPPEFPSIKTSLVAVFPDTVEIIQIAKSNQSAESVESETLSALTAEERRTLVQGQAFGAKISMFEINWFGGKAYSRTALFSCGTDTLVLHAVIPTAFKEDLRMANYVTSTVKC